jgi:hypothetical protein
VAHLSGECKKTFFLFQAAAVGTDVTQALASGSTLKRTASVESPQDPKRARHSSGAVSFLNKIL